MPLVALASVASDKSIVPSGSVLLVEMPLIDNQGNWTGKHEMRLMVALDVGGAVKVITLISTKALKTLIIKPLKLRDCLKHLGEFGC